jgi:hypothetical protein
MLVAGSAAVDLEIVDDGRPLSPPPERLRVLWTLLGARQLPVDTEPIAARCVSLDVGPRAECDITARLAHAVRSRQLIQALCLTRLLDAVRAWLPKATEGDESARQTIRDIQRRGAAECTSDTAFIEGTWIAVEDSCGAELPSDW